jgi:hypothetical protein
MSLWIRKRGHAGQWFWLVVEVPLLPIILAIGLTLAVLLGRLAAAPVETLLACFSIAAAGSVFIAVAKWSLFRRGVLVSFGSARMSRGMTVLYRLGWLLVIAGTTITLTGIGLVLHF